MTFFLSVSKQLSGKEKTLSAHFDHLNTLCTSQNSELHLYIDLCHLLYCGFHVLHFFKETAVICWWLENPQGINRLNIFSFVSGEIVDSKNDHVGNILH